MTTSGIGPDENLWTAAVRRNPEHAAGYAARWKRLAAAGQDLDGEARLIDAMAQRGSRILDAGCGTGRVGGYLVRAGHRVVGVDLDPHLIEVARAEQPDGRWEVGNLAELDLVDGDGERELFDLAVCAGNVLTFLAGAERRPALTALAAHLAPEGRLVVVLGSPDRAEGGIVVTEAHGLAPRIGAIAVRPVNGLVTEKDHVTFIRGHFVGLDRVGMVAVQGQVRFRFRAHHGDKRGSPGAWGRDGRSQAA